MPGGRGIAVGGGSIGVVLLVVFALLGVDLNGGGQDPYSLGAGADETPTELSQTCRTGSDANQRDDCRIVAVVNSVQAYWRERLNG